MRKPHAERLVERKERDFGFTLTEVLVAISLLGLAVTVIIAALRTTIVVSQTSDDQAKVEAALTAAADRLTTTDYITCPGDASDYHSEVGAAASVVDWSADQMAIVDIQYWDPTFGQGSSDIIAADGGWVTDNTLTGSGCDDSAVFTTSRTLQRITIQVTSPDGDIVRTIEVVKANICADARVDELPEEHDVTESTRPLEAPTTAPNAEPGTAAGGSSPRRRASGFTLPEVLVAMTVAGTLVAVIATAIIVMLRTTPDAEIRLAESKDVTFLQTWVPVDLATAINSYDDHLDAVVKADLAANDPYVTYNANLPGTNVLTLVVPNAETGLMEIVSYRYMERPGDPGTWQLARYTISNPGTVSEVESRVGIAHEVPAPPDGWVPGDSVDFAFQVIARNQARIRPVGEDVVVFFESGNEFRTGGAGLSAEQDLTPLDPITLPDPIAPPSRCGGPVALVLDTSWSVPNRSGGLALESAATGFIDAFTGTPTDLTILGFDQIAYQLYPNLNSTVGEYISLLDDSTDGDGNTVPDVQDAKNNILALPDVDGLGSSSNGSAYYGDGSAAIGWSQQRNREDGSVLDWLGYTNWHDALHAPFFTMDGSLRARTPELVVWVTDGDPNRQRVDDFSGYGATAFDTDLAAAVHAANAGRSTGARIVGVLVGTTDSTLEGNLADVVGTNEWDGGTVENPAGNAASADYFTGSFAELGNILRQIVVAQCGGTVTVRKELTGGGSPGGQWNYSSETGDQVLDLAATSSITFDYSFDGEAERTISIREEVKDGFTFDGFECKLRGEVLDPNAADPKVRSTAVDGVPGVEIDLSPDEAVSCTFLSVSE